jgi:hypothetical protein
VRHRRKASETASDFTLSSAPSSKGTSSGRWPSTVCWSSKKIFWVRRYVSWSARNSDTAHDWVKKLRAAIQREAVWFSSIGTWAVQMRIWPSGRFTSSIEVLGNMMPTLVCTGGRSPLLRRYFHIPVDAGGSRSTSAKMDRRKRPSSLQSSVISWSGTSGLSGLPKLPAWTKGAWAMSAPFSMTRS